MRRGDGTTLNVLPVDSEEALAPEPPPAETESREEKRQRERSNARVRRDHLAYRDGWDLSDVEPEQIHLMVPCMEAWIAADPDGMALYNIRAATTDSTPSIGSSASAVSNRKSSSPQPVFSTWWKSSIRGRRSYHACLRSNSASVCTGNELSRIHSSGSSTPAGGSGSPDPLDPHRDRSPLGMTGLPDRRDLDPDLGCRQLHPRRACGTASAAGNLDCAGDRSGQRAGQSLQVGRLVRRLGTPSDLAVLGGTEQELVAQVQRGPHGLFSSFEITHSWCRSGGGEVDLSISARLAVHQAFAAW